MVSERGEQGGADRSGAGARAWRTRCAGSPAGAAGRAARRTTPRCGRGRGRRPPPVPRRARTSRGSSSVRQVRQSQRHPAGELVDHRQRLGVAVTSGRLHVLAPYVLRIAARQVDHRPAAPGDRRFPGQHRQPRSGGIPLPAPAPPTGARGARRIDHHVAELAGEPVPAAHQLAVDDEPATDAGAQRRRARDRSTPRARAEPPLRHRRARGVVVDLDPHLARRRTRPRSRPATSKWATPSRFGAACSTPVAVHEPRHADPERRRRLRATRRVRRASRSAVRDCLGRGASDASARRRRARRRRAPPRGLRAADVDADEAGRRLADRLAHASARTFSSRTVLRMRTSARRFTKPGSGIARSISRS